MKRRKFLGGIAALPVAAIFGESILPKIAVAQSEYLDGEGMPYAAFDRLPKTEIAVEGGVIQLAFAPGRMTLPTDVIMAWVKRSAKAVTTYYGRFPVESARLLIVPVRGTRVQGGTTWGYRGGAIRITLGSDANEDDLRRDWIMVHEMVHLALPDMNERYNWLSEGLAVYIEPIARVHIGDLPEKGVWHAMMRDMPKGLPRSGDRGLDNTSSWGRTYWGGALFCLMADIDIRTRTDNRLGLQDAVRGILDAGGNHERGWPILRVLTTADAALGHDVFMKLHDDYGDKPGSIDLDAIWRKLGVKSEGETVSFDANAPLWSIRAAIMTPRGLRNL